MSDRPRAFGACAQPWSSRWSALRRPGADGCTRSPARTGHSQTKAARTVRSTDLACPQSHEGVARLRACAVPGSWPCLDVHDRSEEPFEEQSTGPVERPGRRGSDSGAGAASVIITRLGPRRRTSSSLSTVNRVGPRSVVTSQSEGNESDDRRSIRWMSGMNSRRASSSFEGLADRRDGSLSSDSMARTSRPSASQIETQFRGCVIGNARTGSTPTNRRPSASIKTSRPQASWLRPKPRGARTGCGSALPGSDFIACSPRLITPLP